MRVPTLTQLLSRKLELNHVYKDDLLNFCDHSLWMPDLVARKYYQSHVWVAVDLSQKAQPLHHNTKSVKILVLTRNRSSINVSIFTCKWSVDKYLYYIEPSVNKSIWFLRHVFVLFRINNVFFSERAYARPHRNTIHEKNCWHLDPAGPSNHKP